MYDGELFGIVWSPTVSAIAVVFEHPVDDSVLKEALDGFLGVARVAGHHRYVHLNSRTGKKKLD